MLSGPGGNVVVLYGSDGTVVVDTFVQPAWAGVGKAIKGLTQKPVTTLIDTHWHFDHTDNNAQFRRAGATIVAHANTKKRMSETHELLGITFKPQAIDAVPTEVFADRKMIQTNGETLTLQHVAPAHTDTDVILHFANANVIQTGDVYFADAYPFIDLGTGGNINGMIAAAETVLAMADDKTMLVPGHGPLSTRADLEKSHAMCITVRDRVKKLKSSGRTLQQTVDAKPTADFDAAWGKGFVNPAGFVELVYKSI
jgi:glyoxylase-like metal-dependent hydrolase (beta-lactamase superfamily II)